MQNISTNEKSLIEVFVDEVASQGGANLEHDRKANHEDTQMTNTRIADESPIPDRANVPDYWQTMSEMAPLEKARVWIFSELANLIDTQLSQYSSIEWEERIFVHTVMVKDLGMEKKLP